MRFSCFYFSLYSRERNSFPSTTDTVVGLTHFDWNPSVQLWCQALSDLSSPRSMKQREMSMYRSELGIYSKKGGNPPQDISMSQRKCRGRETEEDATFLFHPCPRLDPSSWKDLAMQVHGSRAFPFSSHDLVCHNHQSTRLLLKRNPGICCNYS